MHQPLSEPQTGLPITGRPLTTWGASIASDSTARPDSVLNQIAGSTMHLLQTWDPSRPLDNSLGAPERTVASYSRF